MASTVYGSRSVEDGRGGAEDESEADENAPILNKVNGHEEPLAPYQNGDDRPGCCSASCAVRCMLCLLATGGIVAALDVGTGGQQRPWGRLGGKFSALVATSTPFPGLGPSEQDHGTLGRSTVPTPSPLPLFLLGIRNSTSCPTGTGPVLDEKNCSAAAAALTAHNPPEMSLAKAPSGCVFSWGPPKEVFFNTNPDGVASLNHTLVCHPQAPKVSDADKQAAKERQPETGAGSQPVVEAPAAPAQPAEAAGNQPVAPAILFVMSVPGSFDCPTGYEALTDITTCRSAAKQLGKAMAMSEPHDVESDPPGCVFRKPEGDVYFNSHMAGKAREDRAVICSPPLFAFGDLETGACPKGMDHVNQVPEDEDLCATASQVLAKDKKYVGALQVPGDPRGCIFRASDKDIFFNEAEPGSAPKPKSRRPICALQALRTAPKGAEEATQEVAANIKIFCFAWTPMRPYDLKLLDEVRIQFKKCDGHAFFTDTGAGDHFSTEDVVKVEVPSQHTKRTEGAWLYHRNMVGVLPSLTHLLNSMDLSQYDWLVHTELDHYLSPARLRWTIAEYLRLLKEGSPSERKSLKQAMMLMFGNAFLFNQKMIEELRKQWGTFGKAAIDGVGVGCPEFMRDRVEWPEHCSQDMVYPTLVEVIQPHIAAFGRSGCGQFDATNGKGRHFPPGCWEMQKNPWGEGEAGELKAIAEFAKVQNMTRSEAKAHYAGTDQEKHWELFFMAKTVPIIHHVGHPSVHKLAREILRP